MVDMGPKEEQDLEESDDDDDDDFFGGDDQYSEPEIDIAKAGLGIIKCSRGSMKVSLEICEDLGTKASESQDEAFLQSILKVYNLARVIGEGVTDLGSLLYPGMLPDTAALEDQLAEQAIAIGELQDFVLGLDRVPKKVSELANILRVAVEARKNDFQVAIAETKQR